MTKALLTLALCLLLMPAWALARPHHDRRDNDHDNDHDDYQRISASETITTGFATTGLIAVGGYLVLRRRRVRSRQS